MDYQFLSKTPLFAQTTAEETQRMLSCMEAIIKIFQKDDFIMQAGDKIEYMGCVLSGSVYIMRDDIWGNRTILGQMGPGQIFAETYACIPGASLMVSVIAKEKSEILFIHAGKILKTCTQACSSHQQVIYNLVQICAQKNLHLSQKILYTSSKMIRDRLLLYLSDQAKVAGTLSFCIPFNRQQLADYLNVDRSAMSNELSKMQKEGILTYRKNSFVLKETFDM